MKVCCSVLQFGGGRFLRAFLDLFIEQSRGAGQDVGGVVVVQSTDSPRARYFNSQADGYHVLIRGIVDGNHMDCVEPVRVVRRAIIAEEAWKEIQSIALQEDLKWIVSNVTEAGYKLESNDSIGRPRSFPAKIASVLLSRYSAGLSGLSMLPCELLPENGKRLYELVRKQSEIWKLPDDFFSWLAFDCIWADTLVDRIVSRPPPDHPLLKQDRLLAVAEPFAFWGVQARKEMPLFLHPAIFRVDDLTPFTIRKLRILNGAHTALVCRAMPQGFVTVREAMENGAIRSWLERLLFEEIVPVVEKTAIDAKDFASSVFDRLSNPYLDHKFSDIFLYHEVKMNTRLRPTYEEFIKLRGYAPALLEDILFN